jgi:hypothetical protein
VEVIERGGDVHNPKIRGTLVTKSAFSRNGCKVKVYLHEWENKIKLFKT